MKITNEGLEFLRWLLTQYTAEYLAEESDRVTAEEITAAATDDTVELPASSWHAIGTIIHEYSQE